VNVGLGVAVPPLGVGVAGGVEVGDLNWQLANSVMLNTAIHMPNHGHTLFAPTLQAVR
jgi:hypothetical protein